jgi:hypothetical protein
MTTGSHEYALLAYLRNVFARQALRRALDAKYLPLISTKALEAAAALQKYAALQSMSENCSKCN